MSELVLFFLIVALIIMISRLYLGLKDAEGQLTKHGERLDALEAELRAERSVHAPAEKAPAPPSTTAPLPTARNATPPPLPAMTQNVPPTAQATPTPRVEPAASPAREPARAEPSRPTFTLEAFMGVKLFAWLGGLALFLGVIFFIRYSFEHNLITPMMRVTLGAVSGIGLIVGGVLMPRPKFAVTAHTLCATGIVTLYGVTFAAHSVYHFTGALVAFASLAAITGGAFLLAVRMNAQVVAILGSLGGFLTPFLLSTGEDRPVALFSYLAVLDVGLIAVALRQGWRHHVTLAAIATAVVAGAWAGDVFTPAKVGIGGVVFLGFTALFLVPFWQSNDDASGDRWTTAGAGIMAGAALCFAATLLRYDELNRQPWIVLSVTLLADAGLAAWPVRRAVLRSAPIFGAAAAVLIFSAWIARSLSDHLLSWTLGFVLAFAFLHTALPMALRRRRATIADEPEALPRLPAVLAVLPFLLLVSIVYRLHPANPSAVFGVGLLLVVLLLALARGRNTFALAPVALGCAVLLEFAWHVQSRAHLGGLPLAWYLGFATTVAAFPVVFQPRTSARVTPWAIAALAPVLHYPIIRDAAAATWAIFSEAAPGLIPAAFALPALAACAYLRRAFPKDNAARLGVLAWFGGAALFFITLIFPAQFDREWLTVSWALEGAALCWLFHRLPHPGLRLVGSVLLAIAFVRLTLNPAVLGYHARSGMPIWNWYLYTYGLVAASCFAGGFLLKPPRHRVGKINVCAALFGFGTILLFFLLNIEIADFFATGSTLTFDFSGSLARDMTYSIAWALFALGLLLAGMHRQLPPVRYAGIALFVVTLLKLFFRDLAQLDQLYRIGAFIAVAILLIGASYLYQRFLASGENRPPQA